ncbi:phosphatase [Filibacter tadaridae]|uniref:phosphatase n=1 Tax=Filibacter tadaridae TaxID=2483811 RepID=UPI001EF1163B|nr:phosphatase [Filibacter tadaridae]
MIEIKNTNIGLILLSSSAIIYGSALISASIYSLSLGGVDGQGWSTEYGIFGTALREVGTLPIIIAVLLAIVGIVLLVIQERKA